MKISDHVRGRSAFERYRNGNLWYRTDTGYEFPVPRSDTDTATFDADLPSLLLMRWVKKRIEAGHTSLAGAKNPEKTTGATFTHYRAGNLWYRNTDGFEFPVPVEEIDDSLERHMPESELDHWTQAHRQTLGRRDEA